VFAHHRKKVQLLFAIADGLLTILAFEAAYHTRVQMSLARVFFLHTGAHLILLAFCAAAWIALGWSRKPDEYLRAASPRRLAAHALRQCVFGVVLLILFQYLIRVDPPLSRSFLSVFFVYDFLLIVLFRWLSPGLIGAYQHSFGSRYHLVIVGQPEKAAHLAQQLCQETPFPIQVAAILGEWECAVELPLLLARQAIDEVIFAVDSSRLSNLEEIFLRCDEEGVRTRIAMDFFPHVNSDMTLDRVAGAPLLTFSAAPFDDLRLLFKRFLDLVLSAAALIVLSPFIAVIAVLIKLTSVGPVIYRQARCGLNGRRFTMYKFRSMVTNAEELRAHLEHLSEREIAFKLHRDPRVTGVGRWIRKFSIDEIPQLYNVLRGDMSIVGPRPPIPEEVERYERWQKRRLRMRPGLTCLWAVSGRDHIDFNSWMRMDICYIDNWSLKLDWSIILRTIPYVLAGKGAH
jgi:exopolysaccharide biosynthesis polyprenyl glycosylphosphotransferase